MLMVALALSAQAAAAPSASAPTALGPTASPSSTPVKPAQRDCKTPAVPEPNSREIVVCALKPNGYRLDPDVLAARRLKKQGQAGRPHNPHESYADHSCASVGPMGCRGQPTIDLVRTATTLATMADRLSKGEEIGSRPAHSAPRKHVSIHLLAFRAPVGPKIDQMPS